MKICRDCGREKHKQHICDFVTLSDGRNVHISSIQEGGRLHDEIGKDLKVIDRWITPEMREQRRKAGLK